MEKTKIRRLPPCGSCNIEAMEHWLTDMAQEGWRLLDSRAGRLAFVKERPQCPQYCLVPVEKRNDDRPDGVMMANAETHGWNYVAKWNEWFIFRSTVPCPSALYPSPEARAEGLDVIKKRLIQGLIIEGILLVFYFGVIWYAGFANFLLEAMTTPLRG